MSTPETLLARVAELDGSQLWQLAAMAPVEEPNRTVWVTADVRDTVDPVPQGMRCLGAFVDCDTFVALVFDYRENFDPGQFDELVGRCETRWRELFGDLTPHSGENLDAYLTRYFV